MSKKRTKYAQPATAPKPTNNDIDAKVERELDDALLNTFPASDPISPPADRAKPAAANPPTNPRQR